MPRPARSCGGPTRCRRPASPAARPGRKGDQWKTGGGSVWVTGNYDPETNLAFWGTGNGGPWMGDQRPGDNLYTSSIIALDAATGQIKGHFQYHPNDSWDWDEVSPPILVDYQRDGRTVKGLVDVARDGYLWMLERTADKINFVDGQPFVQPERVQEPRSQDRPAGCRSRAQAGHRQDGRFLPGAVGRQGLAAGRLQPEDAAALHPGQREPVRELTGRAE